MGDNPKRNEVNGDDSNRYEKFISEIENEKPHLFSHPQLIGITSNWSNKIGSGGFGDVYKGQLPNGKKVAVKVLKHITSGHQMERQFMAEVLTMGKTYHQNLVKLRGFCIEGNTKALIYDFMENGSLNTILFQKGSNIGWLKFYDIAVEIAKGLSYLHESCNSQIVHHDIKADNVLLDSNHRPKITDFGLARLCSEDASHVSLIANRGTRGYTAPEVCFEWQGTISHKCDVYSFGMLLFEVLRRKRILDGIGDEDWFPVQVWKNLRNGGELNEIMVKCGIYEQDKEKARRLSLVALLCAQHIPYQRPLMSSVVKMLEGEIQPWLPLEPFPYYDFSSSESSSSMSGGRTQLAASDESLHEKRFPDQNASNREELERSPYQNAPLNSFSGESSSYNIQEERLESNKARQSEMMLAKFRKVNHPEGEDSLIIYTCSKGDDGLLFVANCEYTVALLLVRGIEFTEHDVSHTPEYMSALETIVGEKGISLPHLIVKGRSIEGSDLDEMSTEEEDILFYGIPKLHKQERQSELMLAKFRELYPLEAEESLVIYTSSKGGRWAYVDISKRVVSVLKGYKIQFVEHKVSESQLEMMFGRNTVHLPQVFVEGRLVNVFEEIRSAKGVFGERLESNKARQSEMILAKFRKVNHPEGKDSVIVYTCSKGDDDLQVLKCEKCVSNLILMGIEFTEHDVWKTPECMSALETIVGEKGISLPHLIVKGRSIEFLNLLDIDVEEAELLFYGIPRLNKQERQSELMLAKFRELYPPEAEESLVVYTSSNGRSAYVMLSELCVSMFKENHIQFVEHDVSESQLEMMFRRNTVHLPQLFVDGRLVNILEESRSEKGVLGHIKWE